MLKLGWNDVTVDEYFLALAAHLASVLKTDRAVRELAWGLRQMVAQRKHVRWMARERKQRDDNDRRSPRPRSPIADPAAAPRP
jgi:hypothetical protein